MKVGLALPHYDFSYPDRGPDRGPDHGGARVDETIAWARRAESLGFDSVWVSDHFFLDLSRYGGPDGRQGSVEAIVTMAGIATATERVRIGALVLCEAFRPPPMLAKQVATLDELSGGRIELGLGAGWNAEEYEAHGFEFGSAGERMDRLEEAAQVVRALLGGEQATMHGEHYELRDAALLPPPKRRVPLWIGGKGGPRSLRIVAELADGWNTVWAWTPDAYADRARALDAACERAGRDPGSVRRSVGLYTVLGKDPEAAWASVAGALPAGVAAASSLETLRESSLAGTAEECAERARAFAKLGVEELIVTVGPVPFAVPVPEQVEEIGETLLPLVRDA